MKKENKQMAQQRRAEERKKQARKNVIVKICKIGIPTLILFIFIGICVVNPFSSSDSGSSNDDTTTENTNTNDTSTDDTASASYSTDTSLTVENGDTVNIDYVGSIDGVEFSGGNTNGYGTDLTIGSGSYIDDFEEQLIGAHPGDTVDVYATFPEDYGKEELNGKEALFKVVINGIYE